MRWPKPWVLVLVGLIMNIIAMLISSSQIDKLEETIASLTQQSADNSYAIQRAWSSVDTLERKKEGLTLVMINPLAFDTQVSTVLMTQLSPWLSEPPTTLSKENIQLWLERIEYAQALHREDIDRFYLETLELSELISHQQQSASWFKQIALFLQVLGLALILARDLAR